MDDPLQPYIGSAWQRTTKKPTSLQNKYGSRSNSGVHHIEKEHYSSIIEMKCTKYIFWNEEQKNTENINFNDLLL